MLIAMTHQNISNLDHKDVELALVKSVRSLSQNLNCTVSAEGDEQIETGAKRQAFGCD
ncbi:hypothetical protein [Shewanella sp. Actino-trap-3]|uniref:hypothetical protein n=1 Tax=Shewanella sp. Actino-trap-3 TaxID=2058331 RepID=UPI0012FEF88B|nr:hypothetical protein [Shewanella sp. Actino-trap-3]